MGCTEPRLVKPSLCQTDAGYWYIPVPDGRGTKRVWVSKKMVYTYYRKERDWNLREITREYTELKPGIRFTVITTEKGNIVLMPSGEGYLTDDVRLLYSGCGYRGCGTIKYKQLSGGKVIYKGTEYHSPRGSLGVEDCHLIVCADGLRISVTRSGRLYGSWSQMDFLVKKVEGEWKLLEMVEDDIDKYLE